MSYSVSGGLQDPISGTAQHVAGGVHSVMEQASNAAGRAHDGIGEVREVIRAQPITAALVVFVLGYCSGDWGR